MKKRKAMGTTLETPDFKYSGDMFKISGVQIDRDGSEYAYIDVNVTGSIAGGDPEAGLSPEIEDLSVKTDAGQELYGILTDACIARIEESFYEWAGEQERWAYEAAMEDQAEYRSGR